MRLLFFSILCLISLPAFASVTHPIIVHSKSSNICFDVEVADGYLSRAKGLMHRDQLKLNQGMVFLYDGETPVSFWMKNVSFSLDMIFINASGRIVKIHEKAMPFGETPITSEVPIRTVLEIEGGASKRAQITKGDSVDLQYVMSRSDETCASIAVAK